MSELSVYDGDIVVQTNGDKVSLRVFKDYGDNEGYANLTPEKARKLAAMLLVAAEKAEPSFDIDL
jgi:hypothetical protein